MITKEYDISNLIHQLKKSDIFFNYTDDLVFTGIFIKRNTVNDFDFSVLEKYFGFFILDDNIVYSLKNHLGEDLGFDSKESAYASIEIIRKTIDKKLRFAIYKDTGINLVPKPVVDHYIPIKINL